jgi:glucose-6-phosphate 1-epimerase
MNIEHVIIGNLPAVRLRSADGAEATVTLYGAHLVSWIPAGGSERLFCSTRSAMDGSKAIRGGIPLIFPQFSERGSGMRHGFARLSHWRLAGSGGGTQSSYAEFALDDGDKLGAPWPHRFSLLFRVEIGANSLDLTLKVRNTGNEAFSFSAALHTYLAASDVQSLRIEGLQHCSFQDQTVPGAAIRPQAEAELAVDVGGAGGAGGGTATETSGNAGGPLDRIYFDAPSTLALRDPGAGQRIELQRRGFTDIVVWNPGPQAGLSDLGAEEYKRFACIEPACIGQLSLRGGTEWTGFHRILAQATQER